MGRTKQVDKPDKDTDELERIAEAVEKLAGEVEILRGIFDRLQDDFAWALNNDAFRREDIHRESVQPMHITSIPLDPLAPDWHERVTAFGPRTSPKRRASTPKNQFNETFFMIGGIAGRSS
jgi:hypothetical protein